MADHCNDISCKNSKWSDSTNEFALLTDGALSVKVDLLKRSVEDCERKTAPTSSLEVSYAGPSNYFDMVRHCVGNGEVVKKETLKRSLSDLKPCSMACKQPKLMDVPMDQSVTSREPKNDHLLTGESIPSFHDIDKSEDRYRHADIANFMGHHLPFQPAANDHDDTQCFAERFVELCNKNAHAELEFPMLKYVTVGPDHQATLPNWTLPSSAEIYGSHFSSYITDTDKWVNQCILPVCKLPSDSTATVISSEPVCVCLDKGSMRCIRQHITEAREGLKRELGQEKFDELGLSNIGENVALTWTEGEECVFRDIVLANPISLGRNFWHSLAQVFPDKSHRELVNYYYNVFVLRRRAVQNRCDLPHVDSDDDEWQECSTRRDSASESPEQSEPASGENLAEFESMRPVSDLAHYDLDALDNTRTASKDYVYNVGHLMEVPDGRFFHSSCVMQPWDVSLACIMEEISMEASTNN